MQKSLLSYFKEGFNLANKSYKVLIVAMLLGLITSIPNYLEESTFTTALQVVGFLLIFFYLGLYLSLPKFFVIVQKKEPFSFRSLVLTTLRSTKRSFLFFLLLLVIPMIFLGFFFLIAYLQNPNISVERLFDPWKPFFVVLLSLSTLFIYSSVFFSLENKNIFLSTIKSFKYAFKHITFTAVLVAFYIAYYFVYLYFPIPSENAILNSFRLVISDYVGFVATAAVLLYYQNHKES